VALIYNWWSLFVRLADPDHHREVITSRLLLLQAIARKTQHAGRTTLTVSSTHGEQQAARRAYVRIAQFFAQLREKAEQLDTAQRWYRILSEALCLGSTARFRMMHPCCRTTLPADDQRRGTVAVDRK
jgi:hypothetical protein